MTLHWHTEPFLLIGLLLPAWLYSLWIGPLSPSGLRIEWKYPVYFYSGMIVVYLAVGSPIDQIGESYLFSVHMVQHLMLMYASPILLILGLPPQYTDHLLLKYPSLRAVLRPLVHPVTAGVFFTLTFSLWHIPVLYESALIHKWVHIFQHISIWAPSMMVAWCLFSTSSILPALSYPGRMFLIFVLTVGQLPVFGILTMVDFVLYPTYEWAPRIVPLTALEDQVLGGLIMKIGGMLYMFPIFAYCFFKWAKASEAEDASPEDSEKPIIPKRTDSGREAASINPLGSAP